MRARFDPGAGPVSDRTRAERHPSPPSRPHRIPELDRFIIPLPSAELESCEKNSDVSGKRPVFEILDVELDHLVERDLIAATHLPEAGDSGQPFEAAAV